MTSGQATLFRLSFEATRDHDDAPLPKARTDGYGVRFPYLHKGDVIPLFSHFYRIAGVPVDRAGRPFPSARRVPDSDAPIPVKLPITTYVFPLSEPDDDYLNYSGQLHGEYVYIWGFRPEGEEGGPPGPAVKLGLLADVEQGTFNRSNSIRWRWIGTGDTLEIGGYRHRVLAIVPTRELDGAGRDGARMIGWIELDPKAEEVEPAD